MDPLPDSQILQLDSFDAAFPVEPGHEPEALRLFSTLFVELAPRPTSSRSASSAPIRKARNYTGDVYALKTGRKDDPTFYEEYRTHCTVACLRGFPDVFGYGVAQDEAFIVMEWVEGETLRSLAKTARETDPEHPLLPLASIAILGKNVCELLEQANEAKAGFVHRDLSPRNIMLRSDRTSIEEQLSANAFDVCLVDFGSATPTGQDPSFTKLSGVFRYGTPDYAPPEMLTEDVDVPGADRASETIDVYALCSVLFELYTGSTPYQLSRTVDSSPYRIKTERPLPTCPPRDEDGGALARIIESGLALEQANRPSRAQLENALGNWLADPRMRATDLAPARRSTPRGMWQPDYQHRILTRRRLVAASILGVAAIASGALVASRLWGTSMRQGTDLSALPVTDRPYTGAPLFKVNDSQHPGWALADESGQIVCKPQTSHEIGPLREGVCSCYSDSVRAFGFIAPDGNGSYAWRVLPQFSSCGDYAQGRAAAKDANARLWGYIDDAGTWIIPPHFRAAGSFSNGLAAVMPEHADGLWGAIDAQGAWRIEPAFAALGTFDADGCAVAQASASHEHAYRWGIVDARGDWTCAPVFSQLRRVSCGCAPARESEGSLWGYVDTEGAWTIEPRFRDARPFSGDVAAVQDEKTQLWYFIDRTGDPLNGMDPMFWKLGELVDGLAPAQASARDDTVELDDGSTAHGAQMRYGYVDEQARWHMKRLTTLADTAIEAPGI